ncbi:MAG: sigma-70 family RNA polymerase sigma factor [Nibricoccus sp.]
MSGSLESRFLEVHREHMGIVMRTALAFTQNAADRADLCQEILFSLWQALPQFQGRAKISTYVYRVAHSCAMNWKRSRQRYVRKLDLYAGEPLVGTGAKENPANDPRIAWLYACIHELPAVDRSVILLSLDGLSYAEIADVTGLSESNVGVRIHRIKQHLAAQSERLKHEL